jgi:opacity protein-like surface antigen
MAGSWYTDVKDDVREELTALGYTFPIEMEKPLGLGVRAGYRFLPHLAAEAQFQWFSGADVELDVKANKANAIQVETLTFTANLKAYLLTGRIQPFLLTGVGVMHLDADDKMNIGIKTSGDAFVARFGGGLDFYINDHFAFVVDGGYLLPTGSLDNLNQVVWSVGLQYRF